MKKITWHGVLQALFVVGQILTAVLPQVPASYKPYVMSAIGTLQVILHQYALNQPPPVQPPVVQ